MDMESDNTLLVIYAIHMKMNCQSRDFFFDQILMSTLAWITEKGLERGKKTKTENKKQTNKQTTNKHKKNMKTFLAAIRKWKMLDMQAATQVKISGSEKEKNCEKEHIRNLLHKTCN